MFFTASLGYFLTMFKCLEVQWREFEHVVHIVKVQRKKTKIWGRKNVGFDYICLILKIHILMTAQLIS